MTNTVTRLRLLAGCAAVSMAGLVGAAGTPTALADPQVPALPSPYAPAAQAVGTSVSTGLPGIPAAPAPGTIPAVTEGAPAVTQSVVVPAASGTLRDYFAAKNVKLEPQQAEGFTAFNIILPMPAGWTRVPDPNVPDAFAVIANRRGESLYTPNAQVVVYRLVGQFDPKEAITHGFVDSRQLMAWQTTNASLADFCGFPSSLIEGTYRDTDMTLNTSRRHVIVPADGGSYLVSLTVTTGAGRAVGHAPATDAIVNGFRVALPTGDPGSGPARSGVTG